MNKSSALNPALARVLIISFLSIGSLLESGCGKKKEPAPEPAPAPTPASSIPADAPAEPPPPGPPVAAPAEQAVDESKLSNDEKYIRGEVQTLNEFIADYVRANKRVPKDLDEVIKLKIFDRYPPLPAGMQWNLDPKTGKLSVKKK